MLLELCEDVEMLLVDILLSLELVDWLLLELCEDVEMLLMDVLDSLLLDWLDTLELSLLVLIDELELDELDDSSSIDRMQRRSPVLGPGNCRLPVWKLRISGVLTSPVDLVSTRLACQIVLSARLCVESSADPASVAATVAAGAVSSPARCMRVIVNRRLANPTAGPRPKVTSFDIVLFQLKKPRYRPPADRQQVNGLYRSSILTRRLGNSTPSNITYVPRSPNGR